jgi:hypothetical protein
MPGLRCPRCLSPVPASATRCAICGADPRLALTRPEAAPAVLAPRLEAGAREGARQPAVAAAWWLRGAGALALGLAALALLLWLALLADAAGFGALAWPALIGVGAVAVVGALLQLERRWRLLRQITDKTDASASPSDLDLMHLFAARFAPPASGPDSFRPPLWPGGVRADEAAWRAVAATLLDLSERDVVEMEPRALPTPGDPVPVLAVRLVRPLPPGDDFAVRLLHPLARRGVGASTTVSELVGQLLVLHRHPARSLLELARPHLVAAGFIRPGGHGPVALLRPLQANAERIVGARPALEALETRLAGWDEREPGLVATLRAEALAGFLRARARARQGTR